MGEYAINVMKHMDFYVEKIKTANDYTSLWHLIYEDARDDKYISYGRWNELCRLANPILYSLGRDKK